ncbi:contractile injection system protein, VgrG/Pvc8 family [Lacrimispora indolis]|uniref:contractile injection system protein, VgrG/Pvc8 family n=1 Tax=Lacrimispora indolis TaxID=69825 RepID=UPI0012EBBAFF|nr:contractile injection system protein, VgrG/Pvc8 family [Lacrimispora indolis]
MITKNNLIITGLGSVVGVNDLHFSMNPNQHVKLTVDLQLKTELLCDSLYSQSISIGYKKNGQEYFIFYGFVDHYNQKREGNLYTARLSLISASIKLDEKKYIRTFQNTEQTYKSVIRSILYQVPKADVLFSVKGKEESPIQDLLVQYQESDWEFYKRIASHFGSVLIPDIKTGEPKFYLGFPEGNKLIDEKFTSYTVSLDERYFENRAENMQKDWFVFYRAESDRFYQIGDEVEIDGRRLRVLSILANMIRGEIIFSYEFGRTDLYYKKKEYNQQLIGASLTGTVITSVGGEVKLVFDINPEEQNIIKTYPWVPVTGNIFTCMPEKGERAAIIFTNYNEADSIAIQYLRSNDISKCPNVSSPFDRYFTTSQRKEMKLVPGTMGFDNHMGNSLTLEDEQGIVLEGDEILLEAKGKILLTADGIKTFAPLQSTLIKGSSGGGSINICQDFNLSGPVKILAQANPLTEEEPVRVYSNKDTEKIGKQALGMIPAGKTEDKIISQALGMIVQR